MTQDYDPLWYDRVEVDEPMNAFVLGMLAIFLVILFFYASVAALLNLLKVDAVHALGAGQTCEFGRNDHLRDKARDKDRGGLFHPHSKGVTKGREQVWRQILTALGLLD